MTTIGNSVVRNDFRESTVIQKRQIAPKVSTEEQKLVEDKLTLPEVKMHLDDMLKETEIKYSLDESDDSFIIKVMDKKTDKLIKEIPSHDIQVLRKHFRTHLGVLFNELI